MAGLQRSLAVVSGALWVCAVAVMPDGLVHAQEPDNPPVPKLNGLQLERGSAVRVALVDSGVNYLLPEINERLARDSAGQLIGYDFWDLDDRPFDAHPDARGNIQRHGTRTASIVMREAPFARVVPYRYPRSDMTRMRSLIAHAADNNVRVVGLPLGGNREEEWAAFEAAALDNPAMLFVASAGNNGRDIDQSPVFPAALSLPNMLVVTSADDFVRPAEGVNWGRTSVDYMVPAERQTVLRFDGTQGLASGSSYAVPRVVALAARLLRDDQTLTAPELIAQIRSRFANGVAPRKIGQGYMHDPQLDENEKTVVSGLREWTQDSTESFEALMPQVDVPLNVFVLDRRWQSDVDKVLQEAQTILAQCGLRFNPVKVRTVQAQDYLKDLETGAAKTLMFSLGSTLQTRTNNAARNQLNPVAVLFARDTRMNRPFDAEAFGQGNTRSRSWLKNSVWLTLALQDRGIALAHELFHVLANSGEHSDADENLMLGRTTGTNRTLEAQQCEQVRGRALQ